MSFPDSLEDLPIVVFFEDEAKFGRISREMATGDCYSITSLFCNTEAMNEFLKLLSANYPYRIIMILDKVGWHVSQKIQLPDNIRLLHLNPFSPEHNPVELFWREMRKKYFHNNIFETLNDVEETLQKTL